MFCWARGSLALWRRLSSFGRGTDKVASGLSAGASAQPVNVHIRGRCRGANKMSSWQEATVRHTSGLHSARTTSNQYAMKVATNPNTPTHSTVTRILVGKPGLRTTSKTSNEFAVKVATNPNTPNQTTVRGMVVGKVQPGLRGTLCLCMVVHCTPGVAPVTSQNHVWHQQDNDPKNSKGATTNLYAPTRTTLTRIKAGKPCRVRRDNPGDVQGSLSRNGNSPPTSNRLHYEENRRVCTDVQ